MEQSSHHFLRHLNPPGEVLEIPYEAGTTLDAHMAHVDHEGDLHSPRRDGPTKLIRPAESVGW